ncbi:MAG: type I restriction enzyme HsdR N-terminal domain-containing protein [Prevotellaceae bacterium]|nr:type I restriction enzyme HsdR N-terminal domain-containing protein [Prevotellaceae bacterium]
MEQLNLPTTALRLREEGGRVSVFDILRRRYVALTPEEWVRQHFVHYLTEQKGYPATLMGNEISLTVGNTTKRCDTVLYDTKGHARMIIEYKAPNIKMTQKVFDQITRYNTALRVNYLTVSNGLCHYCLRLDYESGTYAFLPQIPDYAEL